MKNVKGLILKDLYLRRKNLIICGITFLEVFILAASVCLSLRFGNLSRVEGYDPANLTGFAYAVAVISLICFVNNGYSEGDCKCRWQLFEYSLPMSPENIAAVRMGLILSANLFSYILALASATAVCALGGLKFTRNIAEDITAAALGVFIAMVILSALTLKYKNPETAVSRLIASVAVICIPVVGIVMSRFAAFGKEHPEMPIEEQARIIREAFFDGVLGIKSRLFPFAALIYAAAAVLGYLLFLRFTKRREN